MVLKKISYFLSELKFWVLYRTTEKYHIVNTGLKPGYYDIPERMLNACFQLLVDYVEIEQPYEITHWDSIIEHSHYSKEIKELYEWWKNRSNEVEKEWNKLHEDFPNMCILYGNATPEYKKRVQSIMDMEVESREVENRNLIRLITIKDYLWS